MKKLIFAVVLMATISLAFAQGSLENPVAGSTESGIGVISGWHCTASNITVTIDGASLGKAGNGTSRGDTAGICGRTDTGFSLLYNFNDLAPGGHTISAYADNQLLETRQFSTTQSGGASFVTGISKTATIADFPSPGRTASITWSQAKQNFVVTGITEIAGAGSGAVDLSSLQGTYNQSVSITSSGSTCIADEVRSGIENFTFNLATIGNEVTVGGYTSGNICTMHLSYVSGNSTSGFNLTGSELCTGGLPVSLNANLRKVSNKLLGTISGSWPSCTVQTTFIQS